MRYNIHWVSFLLASVAGFCDTVTFVAGDSTFSAHVTGNFIVFAAEVLSGHGEAGAWIRLISLPVFIVAVMAGGWIASLSSKPYQILLIESLLLAVTGLIAVFQPILPPVAQFWIIHVLVFLVVLAMGLQNAFGKLYAKETFGPTTMMTGNVTQAALSLGSLLSKGAAAGAEVSQSLRRMMLTIGGFLLGCLLGAVLARYIGLTAIICPGVSICICYLLGGAGAPKQVEN